MGRCVLGGAIALGTMMASRPLRAETERGALAPPEGTAAGQAGPPLALAPPAAADPDATLGLKQFGGGLLTLVAAGALGYGLFVAADHADSTPLAYGALSLAALAPAGVGIAVCEIGTTSKRYDGRCVPAAGGAYIGALGVIPGALLGALTSCSSSSSSSDEEFSRGLDACAVGIAVGGMIGYTTGTLIGALSGWNIFKRPKPGTLRAALF